MPTPTELRGAHAVDVGAHSGAGGDDPCWSSEHRSERPRSIKPLLGGPVRARPSDCRLAAEARVAGGWVARAHVLRLHSTLSLVTHQRQSAAASELGATMLRADSCAQQLHSDRGRSDLCSDHQRGRFRCLFALLGAIVHLRVATAPRHYRVQEAGYCDTRTRTCTATLQLYIIGIAIYI